MAQLAIAWLLAQDTVASAIIGASKPEQIINSAAATDHQLSPETSARIDTVLVDSIDTNLAEVYEKSPRNRR